MIVPRRVYFLPQEGTVWRDVFFVLRWECVLCPKEAKRKPQKQKNKKQGNRMTCYMFDETETQFLLLLGWPQNLSPKVWERLPTVGTWAWMICQWLVGQDWCFTPKLEPSYLYLCSSCTYFLTKHPKNYTSLRSNNNLKMPPSPPITLPYTWTIGPPVAVLIGHTAHAAHSDHPPPLGKR